MRNLGVALLVAAAASVAAADARNSSAALRDLIAADQTFVRSANPESATQLGDHRFDSRWTDYSPRGLATRRAHAAEVLTVLRQIDRAALAPPEALNYDLLRRRYEFDQQAARFPNEHLLLDHFRGAHLEIPVVLASMRRDTARDYHVIITRLERLPDVLQQWQALLEEGLRTGVTPPRGAIGELPNQVLQQVSADNPLETPLLAAFATLPAGMSASEGDALRVRAVRLFTERLQPAYQRFHAFLEKRYVPSARSTVAFSDLPDGAAWYRLEVARHTSTTLMPEEIHRRGRDDIDRLSGELQAVMKEVGFTGSLQEFRQRMEGADQHFATAAEVLTAYRDIAKRVDPYLPRFFRRLPRTPFGVELMPSYVGPNRVAYYIEPPADGTRPGNFFVPRDVRDNPKWKMVSLVLHEAMPGHHLERGLTMELADLPDFRKWHTSAFSEGWAQYADVVIGRQMGFYDDPYARYGSLLTEMITAVGAAIDTGLHEYGWSRERALDFRRTYLGGPDRNHRAAVNRMAVWPGQIMAYPVGAAVFRELREDAARRRGPRFEEREFHDVLLKDGPLPLDVLEQRVRTYYATRQ